MGQVPVELFMLHIIRQDFYLAWGYQLAQGKLSLVFKQHKLARGNLEASIATRDFPIVCYGIKSLKSLQKDAANIFWVVIEKKNLWMCFITDPYHPENWNNLQLCLSLFVHPGMFTPFNCHNNA